VDSAKFGNEAHFVSYGYLWFQKWDKGSNSHIWNSVKMYDNRLQSLPTDCTPMLTKPCPQRSSNFSSIKHATSSPWDAIDEMGGIAREMVLDMVLRFWCRNDSGRIKSQVLHLATWQGNVPFCEHESCDKELGTIGFHGYFCEKRLRIYWRKWKMFRGLF
jgi:hypothetical protein